MIKQLILLSSFLCIVSACDVLDVEPQNAIPADEALATKAGIERGIIGAYNGLQSLSYYGRTYPIFSDLAADNLSHPPNATATAYSEVDNNAILPENTSVDGIWSAIYDAINVANNVIAKIPSVSDMTQNEKNKALAELYFLRALHHFNLTNYFGAIPIKVIPTIGVSEVNVPRDPVDAVYAQIIADLNFAIQYLPQDPSIKIRATHQAANALLARVHLYHKDYLSAIVLATEVITSHDYELMANYADIFADDESAESIFEVDFTELDRNRIAEYNFPLALNGRREVAPSTDLLSKFTAGDERLAASVAYAGVQPYAIKYDDLSTGSDNFIVLRLAEMYLIRAEAYAALNGDINELQSNLNTIRQRAGLSNVTTSDIPTLTTIIEAERRLEFAFEGYRWFDLVRTGRATQLLPTVTSINKTLFPIPLSELLINTNPGMTQNPGY